MKNSHANPNQNVRVLIPFFCFCCAKGYKSVSDKGFHHFVANPMKTELSTDIVKLSFNRVQEKIQDPSLFWDSIKEVFNDLKDHFNEKNSTMVINSIKRLISVTAFDLDLDERKSDITTHLIFKTLDQYLEFIGNLLFQINKSTGIIFASINNEKNTAFCLISTSEGRHDQLTEILISNVGDYWNTKSFKKR
jgi:hypothetical protein